MQKGPHLAGLFLEGSVRLSGYWYGCAGPLRWRRRVVDAAQIEFTQAPAFGSDALNILILPCSVYAKNQSDAIVIYF